VLSDLIAAGTCLRTPPRGGGPFVIYPTGCGYEKRRGPDYDWDGRKRGAEPFAIFQYTMSGAGRLAFGRERHMVGAGQAMLLIVPEDHRYWLEDGDDWEFFWVSLRGPEALRLMERARLAGGTTPVIPPDAADRLAGLCRDLMREDHDPYRASSLAYAFALGALQAVTGQNGAQGDAPESVARVLAHLAAHPGKAMSVTRMAELAGLSRAHFSRQFTAATGETPADYLLQENLRYAARLLAAEPAPSIRDVAAQAGFADANYFSKAFRRVFGVTPTDFRASGMHRDPARPWGRS
jgi:AraC-like DNA-binding protein